MQLGEYPRLFPVQLRWRVEPAPKTAASPPPSSKTPQRGFQAQARRRAHRVLVSASLGQPRAATATQRDRPDYSANSETSAMEAEPAPALCHSDHTSPASGTKTLERGADAAAAAAAAAAAQLLLLKPSPLSAPTL